MSVPNESVTTRGKVGIFHHVFPQLEWIAGGQAVYSVLTTGAFGTGCDELVAESFPILALDILIISQQEDSGMRLAAEFLSEALVIIGVDILKIRRLGDFVRSSDVYCDCW